MPSFWHGQLVVLVLQIYIHRILVYSWNDIRKALYPYITFSCALYYFPLLCNLLEYLIFVKCNLFIYTLYILVFWWNCCNSNEMFFRLRSFVCCSQSIWAFLTGEVRVVSAGIRALVDKAQRTRHIRTIRKNSSDIGLVISNENDSLEMGSVVS